MGYKIIVIKTGGNKMSEKLDNMDIETIAMTLIGYAGQTKSLAYQAIKEAKKGNFDEADKLLEESTEEILKAHELQTDLIIKEASGEHIHVGLIMVHSQDHLMNAMLFKELATEFIDLYKEIKK